MPSNVRPSSSSGSTGAGRPASRPAAAGCGGCATATCIIGLAILGVLVLVALLAPLIAPYGPQDDQLRATQQSPSLSHLFGTDNFGRDVFSRVVYGARIDLRVGLISVLSPFIIGILLGALAGFYGG